MNTVRRKVPFNIYIRDPRDQTKTLIVKTIEVEVEVDVLDGQSWEYGILTEESTNLIDKTKCEEMFKSVIIGYDYWLTIPNYFFNGATPQELIDNISCIENQKMLSKAYNYYYGKFL